MKPAQIAKQLRIGVELVYTTTTMIKRSTKRVIKKAVELAEDSNIQDDKHLTDSSLLAALDVLAEIDLLRKRDVKR